MTTKTIDSDTASRLRALLLSMARHEDEVASDAAAETPYWEPTRFSVISHRAAAHALRAQADQLLTAI